MAENTERPYNIDEVLSLVKQRQEITSKLKTYKTPSYVVKDESGIPLFRIELNCLGDFNIWRNERSHSGPTELLSYVDSPEEFVDNIVFDPNGNPTFNTTKVATYLQAATRNFRAKLEKVQGFPTNVSARAERRSHTLNLDINRGGRGGGAAPTEESREKWILIFAIPVSEVLELVDVLIKIFEDDLRDNEETVQEQQDLTKSTSQ